MALLHNRPLALSSILLVCTAFISLFLGTWFSIALFILAGIVLIAILCVSYKKSMDHHRLTLLLVTGAILLASLRVSTDHILVRERWEDKTNTTAVAELRVKEIRFISTYQTELIADAITLDGERMSGSVILRADNTLSLCEGDRIRTTCEIQPLDYDSYYEGVAYTYLGEGARAVLLVQDTITLEKSGVRSLRASLAQVRAVLSYRIQKACGEREGSLLSAMLLGTRSSLPDEITRDFSRAGVSHLLALSGLHLSLIVLLLDHFLLLLRIEKKHRIPVILAACLLYLILTGFSYSMIRAVFMLLFVFLAFLFREERDGITSLCFSAALIVLVSPNAVFSTSFRLTFLATLGILIVSEMTWDLPYDLPKKGVRRQLLRAVYAARSSLIISAASLLAVLVVQWLTFGEVSLMTPLANLLLVPLAPAVLVCAIVALIFPFAPIGVIAALPAKLTLLLAELFAKPHAVISLGYKFVPFILIPLFVATGILLLVDLGRRRALVCLPCAIAITSFALCLAVTSAANTNTATVIYCHEQSNEGLILTKGSTAIICDISNGSTSALSSYMDTVREENITEINTLLLTHYHDEHVYSILRFCENNMVRTLLLPTPSCQSDAAVLERIHEGAERIGVMVSVYRYGTALPIFDTGAITVENYPDNTTQAHLAFAITATYGNDSLCYHTATHLSYTNHNCNASTLLLGAHGANTQKPITPDNTYENVFLGERYLMPYVFSPQDTTYKTAQQKQRFSLNS